MKPRIAPWLCCLAKSDQIGVDLSSFLRFCLRSSTSIKQTMRLDTIGLGDTEIDQDNLLDSRSFLIREEFWGQPFAQCEDKVVASIRDSAT